MADYRSIYQRSIDDPDGFWAEAARDIDWYQPWDKVFDGDIPPAGRWFVGVNFNSLHCPKHYQKEGGFDASD